MVCLDCQRCGGKPPLLTQSNSPEAIQERIVFQIENIVRQQNAGTLDLHSLNYFEWKLLEIWREAEADQERRFRAEMHSIFKTLVQQRQN